MEKIKTQATARKQKRWYRNEANNLAETGVVIHRAPINFSHFFSPFTVISVEAEEVTGGAEELYHATKATKLRHVSPRDFGTISVRENLRSRAKTAERGNTVVSLNDSCAMGNNAYAVSLKSGNALIAGKHGAAIALGRHGSAAASGKFSHAVALGHGCNAAASGALGHAVTFGGGWAISGNGNAAALGNGSAVSYGSHGSAIACDFGEAFSFGPQGKAVACNDNGNAFAHGRLGEAVALGDGCAAACGEKGLAIATGRSGKAKGVLGSWLVLAERDWCERIVSVTAVRVDGEKIKADTWYTLKKGEIIALVELSGDEETSPGAHEREGQRSA